jgi:hypothetical protein
MGFALRIISYIYEDCTIPANLFASQNISDFMDDFQPRSRRKLFAGSQVRPAVAYQVIAL